MIRTTYDPEADVMNVQFGPHDAVYDGSEEVSPGIMLHLDTNRGRGRVAPDGRNLRHDSEAGASHRAHRRVTNLQLFAFGTVA